MRSIADTPKLEDNALVKETAFLRLDKKGWPFDGGNSRLDFWGRRGDLSYSSPDCPARFYHDIILSTDNYTINEIDWTCTEEENVKITLLIYLTPAGSYSDGDGLKMDQTLVEKAVASAIENFSDISYAPWSDTAPTGIEEGVDKTLQSLHIGEIIQNVVKFLVDPELMRLVNKTISEAVNRGGIIDILFNNKRRSGGSRITDQQMRAAAVRAKSIVSSLVESKIRAIESPKYRETGDAISFQKTNNFKNRHVSLLNANYDATTGEISNVVSAGVPYSDIVGTKLSLSSSVGMLVIHTELRAGFVLSYSDGEGRTQIFHLEPNSSKNIPTTESCKVAMIAMVELD